MCSKEHSYAICQSASVHRTHRNDDMVSAIGVKINADFVLRGAVILLHHEGVALVHNVAFHSGAPLTAHNNTMLGIQRNGMEWN